MRHPYDGSERLETAAPRREECGYTQYAQQHHEERDNGPDLTGVWELATIEANGHVDRLAEILLDEPDRGHLGHKTESALASMRACLRDEIRRRIIAQRWLTHLHGKVTDARIEHDALCFCNSCIGG